MYEPLPRPRPADPAGQRPTAHQPLPGWPVIEPTPDAVELSTEHGPIVFVPGANGQYVAVRKDLLPNTQAQPAPRDLAPQPLLDSRAQILAAGGVFAGGAGWGAGQLLSAVAGISTGALFALALLVIAAKLPRSGGALQGGDTHITITNHNKWFGKSTTRL
jgi:hypothetical protein